MNSKWVVLSCLFLATACNAKEDRTARNSDTAAGTSTNDASTGSANTGPSSGAAGTTGTGMSGSSSPNLGVGSSAPTGSVSDMPASDMAAGTVQVGRDYQIVTFNKGSDALSESEKSNLRTLIESARSRGEIDRVQVVAWSDKAFPTGRKIEDLPKADQDLAKNRAKKIDDYLSKDLNTKSVRIHNMAQKSNWFARAFNTEDAELKSLFAQKGAAGGPEVKMEEFRVVKDNGGPMKAIVFVQHKASAGSSTTKGEGQ